MSKKLLTLTILSLSLLFFRAPSVHASAVVGNSPVTGLQNGLVGYWTFDGNVTNWKTGKTLDSSGNKNTGTLTSMSTSTTPTAGKLGQALNFDGVNDRVSVGTPAILTLSGAMTASAWVKTSVNSTNNPVLSYSGSSGNPIQYSMDVCQLKISFEQGDGASCSASTQGNIVLKKNTWYHITAVRTGSSGNWTIALYVNGVLDKNITNTTDPSISSLSDVRVGSVAAGGGGFFTGMVDDVRLYNRALSAREVQELYNLGQAKFANSPVMDLQNGLVGYWTFDGNVTNWKTGKTYDQSGVGNNGTLTSMSTSTAPTAGKFGQALNFDGVNDYVDAGSATSLDDIQNQGGGGMTVSAWIRPTVSAASCSGSVCTIVAKDSNAGVTLGSWALRYLSLGGPVNALGFFKGGSTTLTLVSSNNVGVKVGSWNHVLLTWDGSTTATNAHIYLNGKEVTYQTTTNGASFDSDGSGSLVIGKRGNIGNNTPFIGVIDDVRIYKRVLSAREIQLLYGLGQAKFANSPVMDLQNGLIGYWTFDGNVTNWKTGKTLDSSGNKNTGTLTGMSTSTAPTAGKIGQGLNLDGVNDRVVTGSEFIGTGAASACFWYFSSSVPSEIFISNGKFVLQSSSSARIGFVSDGGTTINSAANAILVNRWNFICVTRDSSGTANFYSQGVLSGTPNQDSHAPVAGTGNVVLGANITGSSPTKGIMDDVRIYNRVLSAREIQYLYNLGK